MQIISVFDYWFLWHNMNDCHDFQRIRNDATGAETCIIPTLHTMLEYVLHNRHFLCRQNWFLQFPPEVEQHLLPFNLKLLPFNLK